MKVCLINPRSPFLMDDRVYPPLGLWYVAASIEKAGHSVTVRDMAFGDGIPSDADVYGITGTTPQAEGMRNLVERIVCMAPRARIIAGGPHATLNPEEVLSYGCHTVVCGEGEEAIAGVLAGDSSGIVRASRIIDLDKLPFPVRRHAHEYLYKLDGLPVATMMTSRGCPHRCAFCSKPFGSKLYVRSVENILEEVRYLREHMGFRALMFFDDTLGLREKRLNDLCGHMARMRMIWRCFMRAGEVTKSIAEVLAEGGCVEIGIGVESGSDTILSNIQKDETVAEIEDGIRLLKGVGIRIKGFFIMGLPGENRESLAETGKFLERVPLDDVDFTILSVYRGSPIYENPAAYDVRWVNGTAGYYKADPAKYQCTVRTSALSGRELLEAREQLERRFKRWA